MRRIKHRAKRNLRQLRTRRRPWYGRRRPTGTYDLATLLRVTEACMADLPTIQDAIAADIAEHNKLVALGVVPDDSADWVVWEDMYSDAAD